MKEQYRTGLIRGVSAAIFAFGLFVLKAGAEGSVDSATLFDAGYAGLLAAAPFFGFAGLDAARADKK